MSINSRGTDEYQNLAPQNEVEPKDHLKIGVHTVALGGNGDIAAGAKLVDNLCLSENARHFEVNVYTKDFCLPRLGLFTEQLHDVPVSAYTEGGFNEITCEFEHPPKINGQQLKIDEEAMVFVNGYANEDLLGENTVAIEISEYGRSLRTTDINRKKVGVSTGFNFDPKQPTIQAGLLYSRQLESLLERTKTEKGTMLKDCEESIKSKVGVDVDLTNTRLGFYYVSILSTNFAYFDILGEAAKQIEGPVTIVALVGGDYEDNRDSILFEEKIKEVGFNYVADGKKVDRGSNVTIINPHRLPNNTFQQLTALAELPTVATGDQSLTEAIQRASSDSPNPFLAFTFETKEADLLNFMTKIDPYISKLLASYYCYELTAERINGISIKAMEMIEPYLASPLPKEEIARLFYDKDTIARFNHAAAEIPNLMLEERRGYVDNPELLVDATKTVEAILEAVRMNKLESVNHLIPHANSS